MLAALDSCFGLFRPRQHGTASKQTQVYKKKLRCSQSAMVVGFRYKDEHQAGIAQNNMLSS